MKKHNWLIRKLYKVFPELNHSLYAGDVKSKITWITQQQDKNIKHKEV